MNELNQFEENHSSGLVLIDTTFTNIAKSNLLLLKGFLDLEDKKGYFIAIDRPHQYMAYLLNMHEVDYDHLWFIDTVSQVSGQKNVNSDNVNFLDGPFHIEQLLSVFEGASENSKNSLTSIDENDFIMIDNIFSMLKYNTKESVEDFVGSFRELLSRYEGIIGTLVLDSESNPDLYDLIKNYVNKKINLEGMKDE
ncbi:MAG: hypothetical protein ACLFT7_03250 [Thermoplasmata archaeon]